MTKKNGGKKSEKSSIDLLKKVSTIVGNIIDIKRKVKRK